MSIIAIALLTGTGVTGDGVDKTYTISVASAITLINSIKPHNIISQGPAPDGFTTIGVRGWQLETNVAMPSQLSIDAVTAAITAQEGLAIAQYQLRLENARVAAIARLGENLAEILDKTIVAGVPKYPVININYTEKYIYATTTNQVLLALI